MAIERTDDRLLTVPEAADRLRVHAITVRRHIKAGRLLAVRVGRNVRIRESALEAFLNIASDEGPVNRPLPTAEELERRRQIVRELRRIRESMQPLGMSTAALIRQGREELEHR